MTRTKLLLVSLLLVFGLGVSAPVALAQGILNVTTSWTTLRANSSGDALGPITFSNLTSGPVTLPATESITVTYSQPIVGASGIAAAWAAGNEAYFCSESAGVSPPICSAAATLTGVGPSLALVVGATPVVIPSGGWFTVRGVRVKSYGLAGGTTITANAYASTVTGSPVTFGNGTNSVTNMWVGTVASSSALTESGPSSPGSALTCYKLSPAADVTTAVAENWAGAWTSDSDEVALAPYLATNGSSVAITVTGIPLGLTITPVAPTSSVATEPAWSSTITPATYTGAVKNDTVTFVYVITATNRPTPTTLESASFTFALSSTVPLSPANPPMALSTTLAPAATAGVYPSFSYPVFGYTEEAPGTPITAFTFVDCVTNLLFPYVTNYYGAASPLASWDTAIAVSDTTSDPFTGVPPHAAPQAGTCTFYFYSAGTGGSVGAPTEATPVTYLTPVINSGGTWAFMMSSTKAAGTSGYAIASCGFLNGYGYAELVDNANGLGNWQVMAGYLAKIYMQTTNTPGAY